MARRSWLPTDLPRIHWRLDKSTALRAFGLAVAILFMAIVAGSFGRAYIADGGIASRELELKRLETRLAESKAKTQRLRSELRTFDRDAEVRIAVIRRELGMLRPNERFVVFK